MALKKGDSGQAGAPLPGGQRPLSPRSAPAAGLSPSQFRRPRSGSFSPPPPTRKAEPSSVRRSVGNLVAKSKPRRGAHRRGGERTASGWERTLTTQNSFTNGLVLGFSSPGPQIALPELSAYSDRARSRVAQEAGGRLLRRGAGLPSPGSQGAMALGVSDQAEERDDCCHFSRDLGRLHTARERRH